MFRVVSGIVSEVAKHCMFVESLFFTVLSAKIPGEPRKCMAT